MVKKRPKRTGYFFLGTSRTSRLITEFFFWHQGIVGCIKSKHTDLKYMLVRIMGINGHFDINEWLDEQLTWYFADPLCNVQGREGRHFTCHVPSSHTIDQIFQETVSLSFNSRFVNTHIEELDALHNSFILETGKKRTR